MSAEMDPGTLAVVDQHMAEVDVEIDRLMYVYEQMAKERGDAQAVLNLGKFLAERVRARVVSLDIAASRARQPPDGHRCDRGNLTDVTRPPFAEPVELPWKREFDTSTLIVERSNASNRAVYVDGMYGHITADEARAMARALMAAADAAEKE